MEEDVDQNDEQHGDEGKVMHQVQGLSQNWCSLSPDGLVKPSIGIQTKYTYSVVHYLSNMQRCTSIHRIDLELQLVL